MGRNDVPMGVWYFDTRSVSFCNCYYYKRIPEDPGIISVTEDGGIIRYFSNMPHFKTTASAEEAAVLEQIITANASLLRLRREREKK
jgi:hypothetical protein